MAVSSITVSPAAAAQAYRSVEAGQGPLGAGADFGSALSRAIEGAVATGRQADAQSAAAISGAGNITEVVTLP